MMAEVGSDTGEPQHDHHQAPPGDSTGLRESLETSKWPARRMHVRWGCALIIAIGGVALTIASYYIKPLKICRDVAISGVSSLRISCSPWTVADLAPLLIPPLLLIVPELSELTIMNVLSLKRKAEAQQAEINTTINRQNELEMRLISQVSNLTSSQNLTQHFYSGPIDAAKLPEKVKKEEAMLAGPTHPDPLTEGSAKQDIAENEAERNALMAEIIQNWETIDLRINPRRANDRDRLTKDQEYQVGQFRARHAESIDTVRRVRNSVAHSRPVDIDALRGAVRASRLLKEILDGYDIPPF